MRCTAGAAASSAACSLLYRKHPVESSALQLGTRRCIPARWRIWRRHRRLSIESIDDASPCTSRRAPASTRRPRALSVCSDRPVPRPPVRPRSRCVCRRDRDVLIPRRRRPRRPGWGRSRPPACPVAPCPAAPPRCRQPGRRAARARTASPCTIRRVAHAPFEFIELVSLHAELDERAIVRRAVEPGEVERVVPAAQPPPRARQTGAR